LNLNFDAISRCEWIGASRGQIDELKETQAAVLRMDNGLSTAEDELARLGKDWRKTYRQIKREQVTRDDAGILRMMAGSKNMMNAASGTPKDKTKPKQTAAVLAPVESTIESENNHAE
jgi:capsid protein